MPRFSLLDNITTVGKGLCVFSMGSGEDIGEGKEPSDSSMIECSGL
jgi:hypothetical protein